jgi:sugar lactone lactonase YvrE
MKDRSILIAEIEHGRLYRLLPNGSHEIVIDKLDGKPLGAVNFVYRDPIVDGRVWVTVSTRTTPRHLALSEQKEDGYILVLDKHHRPIHLIEGLCFPNELRIDREGHYVYVAETGKGRIMRFPLGVDGSIGRPEPFGEEFFSAARVDGLAFDCSGNLWVTEVSRNGLYVLKPSGGVQLIFEDPEGKVLNFPASLTFGGSDLGTVYVGSAKMDRIGVFAAPIKGAPMPHWLD